MAEAAPVLKETSTPSRQPLQRQSTKRIALRFLADGMAISAAFFLTSVVRFELLEESPAQTVDYNLVTLIATPVFLLLFWLYGLYEPRQVLSPVNEFKQVFHGVFFGSALILIADSLFDLQLARAWVVIAFLFGLVLVGGERLVIRKILHFLRRRGGDSTKTIVLGTNAEAKAVARTMERERWLGYNIVGFVDDETPLGQKISGDHKVIGRTDDLTDLVLDHQATLVLVAASAFDTARLNLLLWKLRDVDVDLQITSGTVDLLASRMVVQSVAGVPLLYVRRPGMDKTQRTLKRAMDIAGATLGSILLSPLLALIAIRIKLDSPGKVIFKQTRVGRDGQEFTLWKFRTMVEGAEQKKAELEHLSQGPGLLFKLKEDPRVTKWGTTLRKYSLDELAQLWNVLRRDESCRTPAGATERGAAVRRLGPQPIEGQTGNDRAVAGKRTNGDQLQRLRSPRSLLHPELVALARSLDPVADRPGGHDRRGCPLTSLIRVQLVIGCTSSFYLTAPKKVLSEHAGRTRRQR